MSDRVTMKDLEAIVKRINVITGSPVESYTKTGDKFKANAGNYHLSGAYGGWCLCRMYNDGGCVTCPINSGYVSKRELRNLMFAFIDGLQVKK